MMADLIDRQKIKAKFEPWLNVKGYSEGELNIIRAVLYEITIMPSAQPDVPDTTFGNMISRQAAIDAVRSYYDECDEREESIEERIERLPSADIDLSNFSDKLWAAAYERGKAEVVRSKRDCVDLAERVTATFYDQEYEEWTQQTVTIADVLDSVCDEYTILPSADAVEVVRCKDCKHYRDYGCQRAFVYPKPDDFCSYGERANG